MFDRGQLEQAINDVWYRPKRFRDCLLIVGLAPVAFIYLIIATLRSAAYQFGVFHQCKVDAFVIVVGNISVGGTGKTPFTLALCQFFEKQSISYGIVSRGYGGVSDHYPLEVTETTSAAQCGDEPLMLKYRIGSRPVFVGPDRVAAAKALLAKYPVRVVICDDGLQHYRLARNKEFVVIDGQRGVGNGWPFPAGPLREPLRRLFRADAVVINQQKQVVGKTPALPDLPANRLCRICLVPHRLVNLKTNKVAEIDSFAGMCVHAVAGIGNPQRFFYTLSGLEIQFTAHVFPDHHAFQATDFAFAETLPIIMTEKDAVKCAVFATDQMWCLVVEAELPELVAKQLIDEIG
ncbi:MAG: tetraacyldisaccharide 4'-kinase [Gammaproteobacteria bacterium]|nr:MAG: tetraacyldisaccharide 4'-kinase [Gammaproteobacteria bacterium]